MQNNDGKLECVEGLTLEMQAYIDSQKKFMSEMYEKAIGYTNIMILAGYAGFFGLWNATKEHISKQQMMWAALLMLISLAIFVFFEIWKGYDTSRRMNELSRELNNPENQKSIERLRKAIQDFDSRECNRTIWFARIWNSTVLLSIAFGLSSVLILGWEFIKNLA